MAKEIDGGITESYGETPSTAAMRFVSYHRALFGLKRKDVQLRLLRSSKVFKDMNQVVYGVVYKDIPIYEAKIMVILDDENRITLVVSSYCATVRQVNITALLRKKEAADIADRLSTIRPRSVSGEPKLVIYPKEGGRLAYEVHVLIGPIYTHKEYVIDARDGRVLLERTYGVSEGDGLAEPFRS